MDIHAGQIAREAWDFFFRFLEEADALEAAVIVEGGWAVAAHGSPVASIDLDVIVEWQDGHDFYDLLHGEGRYARPGPFLLDWSTLDDKNMAWATNVGYVRRELLTGSTENVVVRAPDGRERKITVPNVVALSVMKLKAFRDREMHYRARIDRALGASFDPEEMDVVHRPADYLLRKAAKDIVDIGYLWNRSSDDERGQIGTLLRKHGLHALVMRALRAPDPDVLAAADYLLKRHGFKWSAAEVVNAIHVTLAKAE